MTLPVSVASNVMAVAGAQQHTVFAKSDGTLWAAGRNGYGQLGDGTKTDRDLPVRVPGVTVASLGSATLSLHSLMIGLFAPDFSPMADQYVAAGHPADLTPNMTGGTEPITYQWQRNGSDIGGATTRSYAIPSVEWPSNAGTYTCNAAGPGGTNSVSATLYVIPSIDQQPSGKVAVKGESASLSVTASGMPDLGYQWMKDGVMLAGRTGTSINFDSLQITNCGSYHVVVIGGSGIAISQSAIISFRTTPVQAWGYNAMGQLGNGNTNDQPAPISIMAGGVAAAVGEGHSLFVDGDGTLWAMGQADYGQLGNGSAASTNRPVSVASNVVAVAAGMYHSLFLTADGALWGMGKNATGQLGNGTTGNTNRPITVASNVVAISAGVNHSLFLKNDGTLWGMGNSVYGQLGISSTLTPGCVTTNVVAISAGGFHSMFLRSDGGLWVMGNNSFFQLGLGPVAQQSTPVFLTNGVAGVCAGQYNSLFVRNDGTLWGAGYNSGGMLGFLPVNSSTNRPTCIASNVVASAARAGHTSFVLADGTLWSLGKNEYGQFGSGLADTNTHISPVQTVGLTVAALATGHAAYHSLAVAEMISLPQLVPMADQTVLVGDPASFTLNATNGTGPFTYQWQLDGSEIAGATTSVYSIAAAAQADAGIYIGLVTGPAGTVTNSATLTVHALPEVTAWPVAASIVYGQTLASSLLTGGAATPEGSFDWTTPATALDSGTYDQSVTFTPMDTGSYATTNRTVSITVAKATPSVTNWPTAGVIMLGQALSASAITGGSASVPGGFAFATSAATPPVGNNVQSVVFFPDAGTNYLSVTGSVAVVVIASPTATTVVASGITSTGATLNGSVNPGGAAGAIFQYGNSTNMAEWFVGTLAGSGTAGSVDGTGVEAQVRFPAGVAVDSSGNVYVAESPKIRKVTPSGVVTTLAGSTSGYADGTNTAAMFFNPQGLAVDSSGNVYVGDTGNNRIRKVTDAGVVTTLAGTSAWGFADGTATAARFNQPFSVAVDSSGNVYVGDAGNNRIRKVTDAGVVTTLAGTNTAGFADGTGGAAQFNSPRGLVVDSAGTIYVADFNNNRIRKVTTAGVVTTLAGSGTVGSADGPGLAARFDSPNTLALDASGILYVGEGGSRRIRRVTSDGMVTTIVSAPSGYADGFGMAAKLTSAMGVAVDASGNVYVADYGNQRVRKILPPSLLTLAAQSDLTGTIGTPVSTTLSGLAPETTYYFRSVGTNIAGTAYGAMLSFTTLSTNAVLNNLVLSAGTLGPDFASNTVSYTTTVSNEVSSLTATATLAQTNAVLKVNGTTVASGVASSEISLEVGTNTLSIAVTAQDGVALSGTTGCHD
jgi:alpha-tubulin suppressor-like RCC1 family protein